MKINEKVVSGGVIEKHPDKSLEELQEIAKQRMEEQEKNRRKKRK